MTAADNKTFRQIWEQGFIDLSVKYAGIYKSTPKVFLHSFQKYGSIRSACREIVRVYKANGAYKDCLTCGKDFTDYAQKNMPGKWGVVLAEILLIIYSIIK